MYLQGEGISHAKHLEQTSGRVVQGIVCEHGHTEKERQERDLREPEAGLHKGSSEGAEPGGANKAELDLGKISLQGLILPSRDRFFLPS